MRILQLCPKVPWPPEDGGRIAMRVLARSLRRAGADVRTLALNPAKLRVEPATLPEEARELRLEAVDVDTSVTVAGALRSLLPGRSYNVDRFRSEAFERRLVAALREEPPDVVLLESLFMTPYLPALRAATRARLVLRAHNVEHEIWEGLARSERSLPRRAYLSHLARRLRRREADSLREVDAILPVTPEDAETFARLGASVPVHVAPIGIETSLLPERAAHGDPRTLVFLGALDWRPNLEGLSWFLESVWPLVRNAVPDARLHLGGSNPPASLAGRFRDEGVVFLGRVADAHDFLASGAAMVVPLLSGGGMRVKVLEAMALGVPVVSTTLGAAGVGARDGEEILLADGPEPLAAACASLLKNGETALALGRAGRRRILESFDADAVGRGLLDFLDRLASTPTHT